MFHIVCPVKLSTLCHVSSCLSDKPHRSGSWIDQLHLQHLWNLLFIVLNFYIIYRLYRNYLDICLRFMYYKFTSQNTIIHYMCSLLKKHMYLPRSNPSNPLSYNFIYPILNKPVYSTPRPAHHVIVYFYLTRFALQTIQTIHLYNFLINNMVRKRKIASYIGSLYDTNLTNLGL